jgi:hypothetical protein
LAGLRTSVCLVVICPLVLAGAAGVAAGAAAAAGADAPEPFDGWAARAGLATSAVASSAAVKFLNMVFSLFVLRHRRLVVPIVEDRFMPRALNAP